MLPFERLKDSIREWIQHKVNDTDKKFRAEARDRARDDTSLVPTLYRLSHGLAESSSWQHSRSRQHLNELIFREQTVRVCKEKKLGSVGQKKNKNSLWVFSRKFHRIVEGAWFQIVQTGRSSAPTSSLWTLVFLVVCILFGTELKRPHSCFV